MSDLALRVEHLGKQYRLGQRQRYRALRDTLTDVIAAPFRAIRSTFRRTSAQTLERADNFIWALKDVSFEVKQGEVVGIIGRNGAGKSTLLKIISRITEPTEGRAEIHGRVGSLLEIGTGFHPELTGRENVYLNGAILGMRREEIERKFDEIVAFAEIERFLDTTVKHYSSGMYMRLAFAIAAHLEPEILVMDEVLAVGDAQFQKKCLGKMDEVARGGRTVLFVSHNMNAVEQLCTRGIWLEAGHLKATSDDIRSVITDYLFGAGQEASLSLWVNTGQQYDNPWFKPVRFLITDDQGQPHPMPVSNDADMWVQIEAEVRELDPALTIGYAIYSEDSQALYWSYQTDAAESQWPALHKGFCVLRSRIPKRSFNEGAYHLELIGGLHFREWLFQPGVNAPSIHMTIQGGLSDSPYWMQKRPGLLAPVMTWTLIQ